MMEKRKPHHDLGEIQAMFSRHGGGRISTAALKDAQALGYDRSLMFEVIASLSSANFIKSATAHTPPNSKNWHDYHRFYDAEAEIHLFIKFAGERIGDVILTSFKEL